MMTLTKKFDYNRPDALDKVEKGHIQKIADNFNKPKAQEQLGIEDVTVTVQEEKVQGCFVLQFSTPRKFIDKIEEVMIQFRQFEVIKIVHEEGEEFCISCYVVVPKLYDIKSAYEIANNKVQAKAISWSELPDTNSLWNYLSDDMTYGEILKEAEDAYKERFRESAEEMGLDADEMYGMM